MQDQEAVRFVEDREPQLVLSLRTTVMVGEVYRWIDASQEPNPRPLNAPSEWRTELVQRPLESEEAAWSKASARS
jgi:hypothetical protein